VPSGEPVDILLEGERPRAVHPRGGRPDALLSADPSTWQEVAGGLASGLAAFRRGRLRIRHDLHLGVGFLVATAGGRAGLRFRQVDTAAGEISICEAGAGPAALLIHGLGATKVSFLPTVAALARGHRAIAVDLPGFGDSVKPIRAPYHPPYFAAAMCALLDALKIDAAHVVGNSMGGRSRSSWGCATLSASCAWRCSPPRWPGFAPAPGRPRCAWSPPSWG
jgi:hypothetical protein